MTTSTPTGNDATLTGHRSQPTVITSARGAASTELSGRVRRYTLAMAFRMACFLAMIVVDGWLRWVLLAVAVFMPYLAVVLANQADHRSSSPLESLTPEPEVALTSGPAAEAGAGEVISGEVITVEVISADDADSAEADAADRLRRAA
ncbi:DUF3099 domain-containing protein [uncultured Friedmanniella sp.]|uniref:DUF3099 domain-containing protein n=1 Tax=uncultured Friedmanniella sp. TaxID=335381 RepID=UPI0035C9A926